MKANRKVAWVTGTIIMSVTTVFIVLFVCFRFIVAEEHEHWEFSVDKTGLFLQENQSRSNRPLDYMTTSMGLVNNTYPSDATFDPKGERTQWERFANYIQSLNKQSNPKTQYKLIYMARHAEGWHNVMDKIYGTCWNCYWSQQDGNGTVIWRDAMLTPKGLSQTKEANRFWKEIAVEQKIPFPQIHYVSSMSRTMQTANLTWADNPNMASKSKGFFAKESIREALYACTCSARHPKSYISAQFPMMKLDSNMPEEDTLWHAGKDEPEFDMKLRVKDFLTTVFNGPETFVSATSHGMLIRILMGVIKHPSPQYTMETAQNIPLLIRGDKVPGRPEKVQAEEYRESKTCAKCEGSPTQK